MEKKASSTGFQIYGVVGPLSGIVLALKPGLLCIGRGQPGEKRYGWLLISDPTVSRHHADLDWIPEESRFIYRHKSSTNPTRINGRLLTEDLPLGTRSQIAIGRSQFILQRTQIQLKTPLSSPSNPEEDTQTNRSNRHYIQILPAGYKEFLKTTSPNSIGLDAKIIWMPERKCFTVNTNRDSRPILWRAGEQQTVDKPLDLESGDVLELNYCRYQFGTEDTPDATIQAAPTNPDQERSSMKLDDLQIINKIGQGASSEVFLMKNKKGEQLAGKFLLPHLIHNQAATERFEREAKVAMGLDHPRLLRVFGTRKAKNKATYILSEYMSGGTLQDRITVAGNLPTQEAAKHVLDIATGLDYLHNKGLVHRDIKPSNIFIKEGRAVVADFGIVRGVDLTTANETGFAAGTPHYMSPEQFRGFTDALSDQYSLGIVLYELLTGERLFDAVDPIALAFMHVHQEPEFNTTLKLPEQALSVVKKMIQKDPAHRYPTIMEAGEEAYKALISG